MTNDEAVKVLRNHRRLMAKSTVGEALEAAIKSLANADKPKAAVHCENCKHFMVINAKEVYGVCVKTQMFCESGGEVDSKSFTCSLAKRKAVRKNEI